MAKASWLRKAGCVPNIEPALAPPGCVVKASELAAAGLTAMIVETSFERLPLVKTMVMLVATLWERSL